MMIAMVPNEKLSVAAMGMMVDVVLATDVEEESDT